MKFSVGLVVAPLLWAGAAMAQEAQDVRVTPTMDQREVNFVKADANKDGYLSREEFKTTPRAQPPADFDKVWTASDLNKDGKVSKAEFLDPDFSERLMAASAPAKP